MQSGLHWLALAALVVAPPVWSDTLTLRDGRTLEGSFVGGTTRQIRFETAQGAMTFDIGQVANLSFSGGETAGVYQPGPPQPQYPPQPAQGQYPQQQQAQYPPPQPVYGQQQPVYGQQPSVYPQGQGGVVLPGGTRLVVRMIDAVDSDRAQRGQAFHASLDEPVFLNGQQVIPRGADVIVRLVDARESGKLTGRTSLTLNLAAIAVNGRSIDINTQSVTQVSSSRGARTAQTTGGGAALGAIIGGIAGGGKGAAIGAGAGATAGAGVQVLTKGQRVRIPSETRLSFLLETPVQI